MSKLHPAERQVWEAGSDLQRSLPPRAPLPSFREIAELAGVSRTTVMTAVRKFVAMGIAEYDAKRRRSVWFVRLSPKKAEKPASGKTR
jgi:DNA-binding FadR family transcriptional regulator